MTTTADERARLIASHDEASNSYDKTLLSLASGALGLSIAFVKDIAEHPIHRCLLLTAWVALAISLLVIVFSHMLSVEIHKRLIKGIDDNVPYEKQPRWVRNAATWMNCLAGAAFMVGVGFMVAFAYVNFR